MPCYRPVTVWKPDRGGPVSFREVKDSREIAIPCSRCVGCRIGMRDAWAFRCFAESKMHKENAFITLTYDDEHFPKDGSLDHRHWQLFAKRLRERAGSFRFFMCGEYGDEYARPHYHALIFGFGFPDRVKCNSVYSKSDLYRSELLADTWGKGMCTIGEVTYESARYCAVYTTKRVSKERWEEIGFSVDKSSGEVLHKLQPYGRMSLKPGIGATWFEKYWQECATHDAVFVRNRKGRIPRYFDDMLEDISPETLEDLSFRRSKVDEEVLRNSTRERLEVREACALAKQKFNRERFNNEV